jgi:hypothetical protein
MRVSLRMLHFCGTWQDQGLNLSPFALRLNPECRHQSARSMRSRTTGRSMQKLDAIDEA